MVIDCNKQNPVMGDIDSIGKAVCTWGERVYGKNSLLWAQFGSKKPQSLLKIRISENQWDEHWSQKKSNRATKKEISDRRNKFMKLLSPKTK